MTTPRRNLAGVSRAETERAQIQHLAYDRPQEAGRRHYCGCSSRTGQGPDDRTGRAPEGSGTLALSRPCPGSDPRPSEYGEDLSRANRPVDRWSVGKPNGWARRRRRCGRWSRGWNRHQLRWRWYTASGFSSSSRPFRTKRDSSKPGLELHLPGAFAIPLQWPAGDRCMRWAERQLKRKSLARRGA